MKNSIFNENFKHLHFIGVYGVSMSGLAKYFLHVGKTVTGSDTCSQEQISNNFPNQIKVYKNHSAKNIKNADAIIYSSAIKQDNIEIITAKKRGIPIFKRSQVLGEILTRFNRSIAISGSHGKTTATAMLSSILDSAGYDPTIFLGGEDLNCGNFRLGDGRVAVAEACEYKKNLLDIKANISVVLNVDNDHMDSYTDFSDMKKTFLQFIGNSLAVINADDYNSKGVFNCSTVTFGIDNLANYSATKIRKEDLGYSFVVRAYGMNLGRIKLNVFGKHNIYNALAVFAVSDLMKIPFSKIKEGIERFKGVRRRNELLGQRNGVEYYADYAHHPKEITATLNAFEESGKDYLTVFQPHTYSRTKNLMQEFVCALKNRSPLIIYKTYPAREEHDDNGSAQKLYENICAVSGENCFYAQTEDELLGKIEKITAVKRVIFLGAGDVYQTAKKYLNKALKK